MAEKTQGTRLSVETARAAAKTITAITAASPPVVTSAAHGYANGDVVYIDSVVGMIELNDRAFTVANQATNTFELKGIDALAYTAYASAGSAYKVTLTPVAEVTSLSIGGSASNQIDVTNLLSLTTENLPGLPNLGTMSIGFTMNHTDTGQAAMRNLTTSTTPKVVSILTNSGYRLNATGYTANYDAQLALNDAIRGTFEFSVYRAPAWFA